MSALAGVSDGDQRVHMASMPDLAPDEVWGERAQQLVEYVKQQTPAVAKKSSICVFAMRKGWEPPTREGIIKYCLEQKLLAAYQSVNGLAFKIPLTRVFDQAEPGVAPVAADADVAPTAEGAVRAQRHAEPGARTAPSANYGCPEHGGARATTTTKETTMAKEWITTAEASELLGVGQNRVCVLLKEKQLTGKVDDEYTGGGRKPWVIARSSVIALRDTRKTGEPAAKTPPQREPKAIAAKVARKPAAVAPSSPATGDLVEDVRALLRNVERGWMTTDAMLGHLRELVG